VLLRTPVVVSQKRTFSRQVEYQRLLMVRQKSPKTISGNLLSYRERSDTSIFSGERQWALL